MKCASWSELAANSSGELYRDSVRVMPLTRRLLTERLLSPSESSIFDRLKCSLNYKVEVVGGELDVDIAGQRPRLDLTNHVKLR